MRSASRRRRPTVRGVAFGAVVLLMLLPAAFLLLLDGFVVAQAGCRHLHDAPEVVRFHADARQLCESVRAHAVPSVRRQQHDRRRCVESSWTRDRCARRVHDRPLQPEASRGLTADSSTAPRGGIPRAVLHSLHSTGTCGYLPGAHPGPSARHVPAHRLHHGELLRVDSGRVVRCSRSRRKFQIGRVLPNRASSDEDRHGHEHDSRVHLLVE